MIRLKKTLILLLPALLAGLVLGQGAVSVQPNAVIHPATPGGTVSQVLRIDNPGNAALDISVYPGDWQYDSSGQIAYYPAGTLPRSAAGWLSFDRDSLQLDARGQTEITYSVTVPADAEPGSYWAALFAEGTHPDSVAGGALTTFRMRTAHMIYVNVPPATTSGRITGILGQAPVSEEAPYTMQLTYLNEGNTVQILSGQIEIRTVTGELVDTVSMERQMALPGITRTFSMSIYGPMAAGNYLALAILNYGDVAVDVAGEFVFSLAHDLAPATLRFEEAADRVEQEQLEQEGQLP